MTARAAAVALAGLFAMPALPTCNVYRSDVERICDAEHRSGKTVKSDPSGLMAWLASNVASADGVVLDNQLQAEAPRDRAVQLRTEARSLALAGCPLADAFEAFAVEDEYKRAILGLCNGQAVTEGSNVARLDVAPADDVERMREIREWTVTNFKSPDALAFVDRLAQAGVQARPAMLRGEASRLGIAACPLAATLERPPPTPVAVTVVSLPGYTVTRVDAPPKIQDAVLGTLATGDAAQTIGGCYGPALVKAPALAGSLTMRLTFDGKGKVTKAEEASSSLPNAAVARCITTGLVGSALIPQQPDKAPAVKCSATLALTPVRASPPPSWPAIMPPGVRPGGAPRADDPGPPDAGVPDARKKKRGR